MPPHRLRGHGWPQGANHIDLRYSADALKAISDLQLGSRPRAILKIRPSSSFEAWITRITIDLRQMHICNVAFFFFLLRQLLLTFSILQALVAKNDT